VSATVVDTKALLEVVWSSLLAGVGIAAMFSLAIVGATRFSDMRRDGRMLEAGMFAALMALALAASAAAVVLGVVVMASK
jgi:hypothetical protein